MWLSAHLLLCHVTKQINSTVFKRVDLTQIATEKTQLFSSHQSVLYNISEVLSD